MALNIELHPLLQRVEEAEIFEKLVGSPQCGDIVRAHLRACRECEKKRGVLLRKKLEELPPEKRERLAELSEQLAQHIARK